MIYRKSAILFNGIDSVLEIDSKTNPGFTLHYNINFNPPVSSDVTITLQSLTIQWEEL